MSPMTRISRHRLCDTLCSSFGIKR
ncbi:hypothetical protein J2X45_003841 [Caulobacter sp. BE264]|nr:hypothetical protein [Caulobacter sp. BE264]